MLMPFLEQGLLPFELLIGFLLAAPCLWNARTDPKRRVFATGAYTHVLDQWGTIYDQPIVLGKRQAVAAIQGVTNQTQMPWSVSPSTRMDELNIEILCANSSQAKGRQRGRGDGQRDRRGSCNIT